MKEITTPIKRTLETYRKQYTYSLEDNKSHTYQFQNSSIIPQLGDLHWLCTLRQSTHDWDSHGQGSTHKWSRGVPAGALLPTGLREQGAFLLRAWDLVRFSGVSVCLLSALGLFLQHSFTKLYVGTLTVSWKKKTHEFRDCSTEFEQPGYLT